MRKFAIAALFIAFAAGAAHGREASVMNQAGAYESTMQFYLHPAHGFPGKPEAAQPSATLPDPDKKTVAAAKQPVKPAVRPDRSLIVKTSGHSAATPAAPQEP